MLAAIPFFLGASSTWAQDDLIDTFAATGLGCKPGDTRPGCNKVWKVPSDTISMCQTDPNAKRCGEVFTVLKRGAIIQMEPEPQKQP